MYAILVVKIRTIRLGCVVNTNIVTGGRTGYAA